MIARRQGRPRSREAHAAILGAAISQTRKVGYDAVTMDGIAASAGVGKATIYRRWKSKEAVVCEALEQIMRGIPTPDTGSTRGDLRALMREQLGLYRDPASGQLLSGLVAQMNRSPKIARAVRQGFHAARQAAMVAVLKRGVSRGDLRRPLDLELALDLLNGPLFYRFLFTGKPVTTRVADGVATALLAAFSSRA